MPKKKTPTPQEIYLARKKREEEERDALLPPGFINHGNTCFMNSVLQGLLATKPLHDLVLDDLSSNATYKLDPHRSPQLCNDQALAQGEREMMPLGNTFIHLMQRAWDLQSRQRRESMSPKSVLAAIGKKYDQYLDFAQQDAHEFLRQLLDAMRMEEIDVIKKRRPPPPTHQPKHRSRSQHHHQHTSSNNDDELKDESFVDMLFGGQLASILVCQKCKHVSITHEDFNDLSLSIKPDDYGGRDRKKDRLKSIAKLFVARSSGSGSSGSGAGSGYAGMNAAVVLMADKLPRPSSVPPPVHLPVVKEPEGDKTIGLGQDDERRKSWEGTVDNTSSPSAPAESNGEPKGKEKDYLNLHSHTRNRIDDEWAKLGKRISMLGSGLGGKDRKQRTASPAPSSSRRSLDVTPEVPVPVSAPPHVTTFASSIPPTSAPSPLPTPPPLPASTTGAAAAAAISQQSRSRSPSPRRDQKRSTKPPKPSHAEMEYVKEILADIRVPSSNPFGNLFRPPSSSSNNDFGGVDPSHNWLKASTGSSIEECLRVFSNVEVLEGDNMVGCRRCWKIENGLYGGAEQKKSKLNGAGRGEDEDSGDEDEVGGAEPEKPDSFDPNSLNALRIRTSPIHPTTPTRHTTQQQGSPAPLSVSTPVLTSFHQKYTTGGDISDDASVSSLPLATANGHSAEVDILVVPAISTTAPESPDEHEHERRRQLAEMMTMGPSQRLSRDSLYAPPVRYGPMDESSGDDESDSNSNASTSSSMDVPSRRPAAPPGLAPPALVTPSSSQSQTNGAKNGVKKKEKPTIRSPAYKRYLISTPPPVLVVHLKRFQQTTKTPILSFSHGFKKIDDYVGFQEYLDLTPFLVPRKEDYGLSSKRGKGDKGKEKRERCLYRLYAIVVHLGNMLGGHYIAYTALPPNYNTEALTSGTAAASMAAGGVNPMSEKDKGQVDRVERKWAYISDTVVRLATLEEVLKSKAYLCMYERIPSF